jgi:branched-subunit amino acid ABC-type transport system permease component
VHLLVLAIGFGLITASVLALAGVAVTLQFGVTNYINFAYGSYLTLAAYVAWEFNVRLGVNFWIAVAASALCMAVFAVIVNRILLQPFAKRNLPFVYLLIVTLGLWLVLSNAIVAIWGTDTQQFNVGTPAAPMAVGPFLFTPSQLLILLIAGLAMFGVHLLLTRTKLGKAMRALADDADLAQVSGIDTDFMIDVTWFLTGLLVGIAGCVLALNLSSFEPSAGDQIMFVIFSGVILGGIGQPYGTMLGALIVGLATEMSAVVLQSGAKADVAYALLILMLLVRPQGLIPARKT